MVGGGLVGCLLAIYLREKHGFEVSIYEGRDDPREQATKGRSINLVITSRGIHALTSVSPALAAKVMAVTTRVEGRTLHDKATGETQYQSYGPTSAFCNFSVSRWELNRVLMDAAEESGCAIHFKHPVAHADISNRALYFYLSDPGTGRLYQKKVTASLVFGADGGGSRCRQALRGLASETGEGSDESQPLGYGYKELHMPAAPGGGYPVISSPSVRLSFSQSFNRADKIRRERRAGSLWRGRDLPTDRPMPRRLLSSTASLLLAPALALAPSPLPITSVPLCCCHFFGSTLILGPLALFAIPPLVLETLEWMLPLGGCDFLTNQSSVSSPAGEDEPAHLAARVALHDGTGEPRRILHHDAVHARGGARVLRQSQNPRGRGGLLR